jgi:hypothetical protein
MADLPMINEIERRAAPATTPQALAWHHGELWFGSRDLGRIYRMDTKRWKVLDDVKVPGIPWAAVSAGDNLWFTVGEGTDDDRYLRCYIPGKGFAGEPRIPCPDFTGSYLSYDGNNLYLSQWYNFRILKLDSEWNIVREIAIGAEISGHVFVGGLLYVLRGTEQKGGDWRLARLDPAEEKPTIHEMAKVPFQCRSLTFDGRHLWTNYRDTDQIVCFAMPQ